MPYGHPSSNLGIRTTLFFNNKKGFSLQEKQYIQEDEIDLKELFITIWNKKIFIVTFTIIITILAGIYAFTKTPIYEATALVEIGSYKLDNNNTELIDNASQLSKKLNVLYIDMLKNQKDRIAQIDSISVPKGQNNFLEIRALATSNKLANEEINKVIEFIKSNHEKLINDFKSSRKNQYEIITNQIKNKKELISNFNANNISTIEMLEVLKLKENIDTLTIKQNEINELLMDYNYKNSEVIGKIITNDYPIKPKKKLIVAVAFVTGFILSIFIVFFMQFIRSFKEEK